MLGPVPALIPDEAPAPRFHVQPQELSRMARTLSTFRTAGALSLLAALAFLPGCSGNSAPDSTRIVYAVRQNTSVAADGTVSIDVASGMGQVMDYGRYDPGGRL